MKDINKREIVEKVLNPSKLGKVIKYNAGYHYKSILVCDILKDEYVLNILYDVGYRFAYKNKLSFDEIKGNYISIYLDQNADGDIVLDLRWGGLSGDGNDTIIDKKYFYGRKEKLKRLLK